MDQAIKHTLAHFS